MSKLLLDTYPLVIIPELAERIGLNEAIVLQQVEYWLAKHGKTGNNLRDVRYWVYNTYEQWNEQFPFWSLSTVKRTIASLEKKGLLIVGNYNKMKIDKTKWYTIDYDAVDKLQIEIVKRSKCIDQEGSLDRTIPETTAENTAKTTKKNAPFAGAKGGYGFILEDFDSFCDGIDDILKYYYEKYEQVMRSPHPPLARDQLERIYETLDRFMIEIPDPEELVDTHFSRNLDTDYNVNHFATEGILRNLLLKLGSGYSIMEL